MTAAPGIARRLGAPPMRARIAALAGALVLGLGVVAGCGGGGDQAADTTPTPAATTAPQEATAGDHTEWADQKVTELLAEYRVTIAQHCLAVVKDSSSVPASSYGDLTEAIDGTISIARARPDRTVDTSTGVLRIDDWLLVVADAARCDEPAAERLRHAARTLKDGSTSTPDIW